MSLIPDLLMEIVIDYLGRYVAGEHRAVAKHWTLLPRATTFVQCSRSWQTYTIAETIDKIRLDAARHLFEQRPSTQVDGRCELCLLALDEGDAVSQHDVGLATIVTFTRACRIPSNPSTVNYFDVRRSLVRLNLCFLASLIYWTKDGLDRIETMEAFGDWCRTMNGEGSFETTTRGLEWAAYLEWARGPGQSADTASYESED